MTEKLTKERIEELLKDVREVEDKLNSVTTGDMDTSELWAVVAITKAKLTAMKGERK